MSDNKGRCERKERPLDGKTVANMPKFGDVTKNLIFLIYLSKNLIFRIILFEKCRTLVLKSAPNAVSPLLDFMQCCAKSQNIHIFV